MAKSRPVGYHVHRRDGGCLSRSTDGQGRKYAGAAHPSHADDRFVIVVRGDITKRPIEAYNGVAYTLGSTATNDD